MKHDISQTQTFHCSDTQLALLSDFDSILLDRYQWMFKTMRDLASDGRSPFQDSPPLRALGKSLRDMGGQDHLLTANYALEKLWLRVVRSASSGEKHEEEALVGDFCDLAEQFMREGDELRRKVWRSFSTCDALTGAQTRVLLNSTLLGERERASRLGLPCVLVLFDHDDFKEINDRWGHAAGDDVLTRTAALMKSLLRTADLVFRFGGDEWLVFLPATGMEEARATAARLQTAIGEQKFVTTNGLPYKVSVTMGLAESIPDESPQAWIARADAEMYRSKARRKELQSTRLGNDASGPFLLLNVDSRELSFSSDHPVITLGRNPASDIVAMSYVASRDHARIEFRSHSWVLVDQSTNGTYVATNEGNEFVVKRGRVKLQGSGKLSFGHPLSQNKGTPVVYEVLAR